MSLLQARCFLLISLWILSTYTLRVHMLSLDDHPVFCRMHKKGINLFVLLKTSVYSAEIFKYSLQTQKYNTKVGTLEMVMQHWIKTCGHNFKQDPQALSLLWSEFFSLPTIYALKLWPYYTGIDRLAFRLAFVALDVLHIEETVLLQCSQIMVRIIRKVWKSMSNCSLFNISIHEYVYLCLIEPPSGVYHLQREIHQNYIFTWEKWFIEIVILWRFMWQQPDKKSFWHCPS